jgi:hypothetical protein
MPRIVQNRGRLNNFISGITGVQAGGTAVINMPVNLRVHRLNFQTAGIGYGALGTTPTAVPTVADAGATFTVTTIAGVVTAIPIVGAVSVKANGTYALTITGGNYTNPDGTVSVIGAGATGTYTVVGLVVTATTVTSGGTVAALPPEAVITSFKQLVNGVNMRDINPVEIRRIPTANPFERSYNPQPGEFPIYYTEPWRSENQHNELTSWDLFGQNTWQIQVGISAGVTSPSLVGSYEFDYMRNTRPGVAQDGKTRINVPFLQPVAQHQFQYPVPLGRFDLTTLPIDFPIARLWFYGTDALGVRLGKGCITQLEIYQDGNKILEASQAQFDQIIAEYGFNWNVYDAAFIADIDQRLFKALSVANNLIVRVYSAVAMNLNVVMETLPGQYS